MKEELLQKLSDLVGATKDNLLLIADKIKEQLPILCSQILKYELAKNWLIFSLSAVGLVGITIWMIRDMIAYYRERDSLLKDSEGAIVILWLVLGLLLLGSSLFRLCIILKISLAPNLFILDKILSMLK